MKKTLMIASIMLMLSVNCFAQRVQGPNRVEVLTSDLKNVDEVVSNYTSTQNSLDELLEFKRPELIFYVSNKKIEFENDNKLKQVIDDYWKAVIEYNFKTYPLDRKQQRKHRKITNLWGKQFSKLSKKLTKLKIKADNIDRDIHYTESLQVIIFLNKLAEELVVKSKKIGDNYRDLQIIDQPKPAVGNCIAKSGSIELRVTFDESAKVTNVFVINSSGCNDFDFNAIEAAKNIKFTPAILEGKPTTVSSKIVYSFNK